MRENKGAIISFPNKKRKESNDIFNVSGFPIILDLYTITHYSEWIILCKIFFKTRDDHSF